MTRRSPSPDAATPPSAAEAPVESWSVLPDLKVEDPAAVEVLWHAAKRVHLKPFIGRSTGLAEAAQELGIKKTAMSYWIGRLLDVGLIRLVDVDRRTRHRVPRYRCVADRLRVGLVDAPLSSHEGLFDDVDARWREKSREALARSMAKQAPFLDLAIHVDPTRGLATELVPSGETVPTDDFIYYWARFWLDETERDALRAELNALWDKYQALSNRETKRHAMLMHLVAVPDAK